MAHEAETVEVDLGADQAQLDLSVEATPEEGRLDEIVGALEDIMMEPEFQALLAAFRAERCECFDAADENKLEYMEHFTAYQATVERWIEARLAERVPRFSAREFEALLVGRESDLAGDVLDLVSSFSDFATFKDDMVAAKHAHALEREAGRGAGDASIGVIGNGFELTVSPAPWGRGAGAAASSS